MRALVLLAILTASCTSIQINSRSSSAGVYVQADGALAAVILAGMVVSAAVEDARNPQPFPSLSVFREWMGSSPPPPMDPNRSVSEQDCTKPVNPAGNLRCK